LINGTWGKHAADFIAVGRYLREAKDELTRDEFEALIRLRLAFDGSTARKLMRCAAKAILCAHVHELPPCWGTIYELSKLADEILEAGFANGLIHPGLQRRDIRSKVLGLPPREQKPPKEQKPPPSTPPDLTPSQLRAQLEKLGPLRFRQEGVLPPAWVQAQTHTALSLASPNQLLATLERQVPPGNKPARKALQQLKGALFPTD
jgi:hypothetical protein